MDDMMSVKVCQALKIKQNKSKTSLILIIMNLALLPFYTFILLRLHGESPSRVISNIKSPGLARREDDNQKARL